METLTVLFPAACCAAPENLTTGPDSEFKISISFMLAPAPLLGTERALKTASLAAHRPAKEASESGAPEQYSISASVKFRSRKLCDVGTLEINSVSTLKERLVR